LVRPNPAYPDRGEIGAAEVNDAGGAVFTYV
jgi:hypothetical protein